MQALRLIRNRIPLVENVNKSGWARWKVWIGVSISRKFNSSSSNNWASRQQRIPESQRLGGGGKESSINNNKINVSFHLLGADVWQWNLLSKYKSPEPHPLLAHESLVSLLSPSWRLNGKREILNRSLLASVEVSGGFQTKTQHLIRRLMIASAGSMKFS